MKEIDIVQLKVDLPEEGLRQGAKGTIVHEFSTPRRAFEVVFDDEEGNLVAQCTLLPEQLELVWEAPE